MKSDHYEFAQIGEGVTFARATRAGGALSNSGLIDLDGGTLVFDTALTPFAAEDLARASLEQTGRRPTVAANSHWHLDHLLGNQVFEGIPTYSTARTRSILEEKREALSNEIRLDTMEADVRKLEAMLAAATSPEGRASLTEALDLNRWVLRATPDLRLTLPSRTFEGRLRLPGPRPAELICLGSGHTESDAILSLPDDGIVFAGDLIVVGTHPNLTSGDPEHWLDVLRGIRDLHPERIVPGHGPLGSPEAIDAIEDYLRVLLAYPDGGTEVPPIPARFRDWGMNGQFEENVKFLRSRSPASSS